MTTRQMIRNCGFTSSDGKRFIKILGKGYKLEARLAKIQGNKCVIVQKYHADVLRGKKVFMEDVDAEAMAKYCSIQSF